MPRIPTGNFGFAGPAATVSTPVARVNTQETDAAARLGAVVTGIANQEIDDAAREQRRQELQREHDAKVAADRADASKALIGHANIQNGLADTYDGLVRDLQDGKVDKVAALAAWKDSAEQVVTSNLEAVPADRQDQVRAQVTGLRGKLENQLFDAFRKRDEQEIGAGLATYREQQQRFATTDPAAAIKQFGIYVDQQGPAAGWSAQKIGQEKQRFAEEVTYTRAYETVSRARNNRAALDVAEQQITGMTELDPQKRATLIDRVTGYKFTLDQKAELQAQRAARQAETNLRRAEATFQAFQGIADKGLALDPAYIDQVVAQTAGTPYQASVKQLAAQAAATGGLASKTVAQQRAELDTINAVIAREGNNPALAKRKTQVENVLNGSQSDIAKDPMRAYLERSADAASFTPLDTRSIGGLVASLQERMPIAARASTWSGGAVAPLTGEEIEPVRKLLEAMPPAQRGNAIATLATAVGPQAASGMAKQIAGKDRALGLAFGLASAQTTQGRFTSELVLKGSQAIKDKAVKEDNAALSGIRARVTAEIGDAYVNQETRAAVIDAAVFAEYGLQSEGSGDLSRAVRLVTGGLTERNGRKIPLPYGMPEAEFDKRVKAVTPASFGAQTPDGQVFIAGKPMPIAQFVQQVPNATLLSAGQGRYAVQAAGGVATNSAGRPLILEVR